MPIILPTGLDELEPPTDITSPDGILRAKFDPNGYGVFLEARFYELLQYHHISFFRADGTPVRGGQDRLVLDWNYAYTYDHEVPIGGTMTYYAVAYISDPTLRSGYRRHKESQRVSLRLPRARGGPNDPSTMIKSVSNPSLYVSLMINDWASREIEVFGSASRLGRRNLRASGFENIGGHVGDASFVLMTEVEEKRLLEILRAGTFFVSTDPKFRKPTMYADPTSLRLVDHVRMDVPEKIAEIGFVEVVEPSSIGQPTRIPNISYGQLSNAFKTYSSLDGQDYNESLRGI